MPDMSYIIQKKNVLERLPLERNIGLTMQIPADASLAGLQELSNHMQFENNEDAHHVFNHSKENISITPHSSKSSSEKEGDEIIEQFESGVYITFIRLQDGTKAFKRIRFR